MPEPHDSPDDSLQPVPPPAPQETPPAPAHRAPSLLKAAGLIAGVTMFSKLLGFIRDWAVMYVYGTSLVSDAYYAAFQLPAFAIVLLGGLGGPFHTTTVAVFSRLLKDTEAPSRQAKLLASTFLTLTGIVFAVLSLLVFLFAEPIMGLILSRGNPELIELSAAQLRVMSPCIFAGGLVGILYGLSNLYNCFFWPSLSPVAMSLTIMAGLLIWPDPSGMVLAWATLAGAGLQVLMQLPEFFRQKFTLKPSLQWKAPELHKAGEMLWPATIGTTIGQLVTYVDMFWASTLVHGAWAAVTLSNRLIQLPVGVLQTALLVPIFPRFSRAAADGDLAEIKRNFKVGVVSLWLISIPMLVLMLLYTEPLIRLIFQYGNFTAESTAMVSQALIFQAFQIIPYFARDSITRVFYAFQDTRTPMIVGLIAIGVKALLNFLLVPLYGIGGITFAITLFTFFNMIVLGVLSRKHVPDLGFREMMAPFGKLVIAGTLMGLAIYLVQVGMEAALAGTFDETWPFWAEYAVLALVACCGLLVYAAVAVALRVSEAQYLQERLGGAISRRLKR